MTAIEDYQSELRTRYPALSQEELDNLSPKELAEKEKIAYDVVKAGDILSEVADRKLCQSEYSHPDPIRYSSIKRRHREGGQDFWA